AEPAGAAGPAAAGGAPRRRIRLLARQCLPARRGEPFQRRRGQVVGAIVERVANLISKIEFRRSHKLIPLALSATASARVALAQCVLTLPAAQPMAAAVSCRSIPS